MGPPLQDFLCAFEPSDWVFPVAHSANCCVPSTSIWSLSLAQVPKSLLGRLTSILPSLDMKTARSWRGTVFCNAPRTGGAYDSHHRTAEIAGRTRRRGDMGYTRVYAGPFVAGAKMATNMPQAHPSRQ